MKLTSLSVILSALLFSVGSNAAEIYNKNVNKLDVYGKVNGLKYFSHNKGDDGDHTFVRFGFKGETQISDEITGYGQWEHQFTANKAESDNSSFTRIAFSGLKFGDFGSLDYGRNYGVIYDVTSWTDALPEFGGPGYGADNFLQQRATGVATYRNQDFFGLMEGLNFALQYQGKNGSVRGEDETGRSVLNQNGDSYGASLTYDIGSGFSIGGAASRSKRTDDQNAGSTRTADIFGRGGHADVYTGSIKYDANNVYLAASFTQTYNATRFGNRRGIYGFADKAQNFEAVAQYQFDSGIRPSIAYLQSRAKDVANVATRFDNEYLYKYVELGATYYFNANFATYVDYKLNLLDDNRFTRAAGISTDNIIAVAASYQF